MNALHPSADPAATLPDAAADRLDRATRAVRALEGEQQRLARLGFETPLARVHEQLRYWRFVQAMMRLAAPESR